MEPNPRLCSTAMRRFLEGEASGGLVLMTASALALIVANSPFAEHYFRALQFHIGPLSIAHLVNDGLMSVFFLLVGLEIKRELLAGQLATWRSRILPGTCALGGMVAPAFLFAVVNWGNDETIRGWAIPTATDIAFALGILSLLGNRVPTSMKVFLTALAIIDDLAAVLVIAAFYSGNLQPLALGGAALILASLIALNRAGVKALTPFVALGLVLWLLVFLSGVHATVAGVALALTVPLETRVGTEQHSPLHRLELALSKVVPFVIVPIFGFANAGVSLAGVGPALFANKLTLGVAAGLVVGKFIGVYGSAIAILKLGLVDVPRGASQRHVIGVSLLCGVGFTMSLFIGLLAFPTSQGSQDAMKIGVLVGSTLSGLMGAGVLISQVKRSAT